jgi:hypothetical protein
MLTDKYYISWQIPNTLAGKHTKLRVWIFKKKQTSMEVRVHAFYTLVGGIESVSLSRLYPRYHPLVRIA